MKVMCVVPGPEGTSMEGKGAAFMELDTGS